MERMERMGWLVLVMMMILMLMIYYRLESRKKEEAPNAVLFRLQVHRCKISEKRGRGG